MSEGPGKAKETIVDTSSDEFKQALADAVAEEVAGLKTKNRDLLGDKKASTTRLRELQTQLDQFDGLDVDKYETLIAEADKRDKEAAQNKGDFDRLEEQLRTQHKKDLDTLTGIKDAKISTLDKALHKEMIERRAIQAIAKAGGRARSLRLEVITAMSLREDGNGGFTPVFLGDNGEPRLSADPDSQSDFMTADEYVELLKLDPDFAPLFDGTGAGGGGATGSNQGGKAGPKTVSSTDPVAMGKMAAQIASGEVEVV